MWGTAEGSNERRLCIYLSQSFHFTSSSPFSSRRLPVSIEIFLLHTQNESEKKKKEREKQKEKEEKQKLKEENIVLGPSIITDSCGNIINNMCIQILKSGPKKGEKCGCKTVSENMCKRHFLLKNNN